MLLLCSECYDPLHSPYLAIISAYKQRATLSEGPGLAICSYHIEDRMGELKKRYQQHQLRELSEGLVFLLDVAESACNSDGSIDSAAETRRQGIVGYIVKDEMGAYLPRTLELLIARLRELRVFMIGS